MQYQVSRISRICFFKECVRHSRSSTTGSLFTYKMSCSFCWNPSIPHHRCFFRCFLLLIPHSIRFFFMFSPFQSFAYWFSSETEAFYGVCPHADMLIVASWIVPYRVYGAEQRLCTESMTHALMFQPLTNVHMCHAYGRRELCVNDANENVCWYHRAGNRRRSLLSFSFATHLTPSVLYLVASGKYRFKSHPGCPMSLLNSRIVEVPPGPTRFDVSLKVSVSGLDVLECSVWRLFRNVKESSWGTFVWRLLLAVSLVAGI